MYTITDPGKTNGGHVTKYYLTRGDLLREGVTKVYANLYVHKDPERQSEASGYTVIAHDGKELEYQIRQLRKTLKASGVQIRQSFRDETTADFTHLLRYGPVDPPIPVKTDSRICFGINYYASEEEAQRAAELVRASGATYNGGYMHGVPCGRKRAHDHIDKESGLQLYAVTC